ncbi:T9SS type A sorting domain-containing protein [bacterium]|nr:T9SS type A sorting domain-containing protein [bacterium]
MKRLKLILLVLPVLLLFWSVASAQIQPPPPPDTVISCDDFTPFPSEKASFPLIKARPGDTALIPIRIENTFILSGMRLLFTYNEQGLNPVYIDAGGTEGDTTLIDFFVYGDSLGIPDSIMTQMESGASINPDFPLTGRFPISRWTRTGSAPFYVYTPQYSNLNVRRYRTYNTRYVDSVNAVQLLLADSQEPIDTILPGNDRLIYVKMEVDPAADHNDTLYFDWYKEERYYIDSSDFPTRVVWLGGCEQPEFAGFRYTGDSSLVVDQIDSSVSPPETTFVLRPDAVSTVRFPTLTRGALVVDTGYVPGSDPVVNSFTANPSTVGPSQSVTLAWTTSNATSVTIARGTTSLGTFNANGSTTTLPPQANGVYTYTVTALGDGGLTASSSVNVTYSDDTTPTNAPNVTFNPSGGVYTTEQGQAVSFTVTATDPDGKQTTLTASNIPNNATFSPNPSTGIPSATGSFSFVPDFNQSGVFTVTFTAVDADNDQRVTSATISVTELQFDRLFSSSAENLSPVGGLPGTGGIYFPINLVTQQANVYGVQYDMSYPPSQIKIDSFVPSGRIPDWVIYDNVGDTPGQVRVVAFGLANEPVATDTTSAILWTVMTIDSSNTPWDEIPITLSNGRESVNPDPNIGSLELVTESGLIEVDSLGDVNLDQYIDVADAVSCVGNIIGDFTFTPRQYATANIIIDGSVNVFDLVGIINSIYGLPVDVSPAPINNAQPVTIALQHDPISAGSSTMMKVTADEIPEAVAGVQLEVRYDAAAVSLGIPILTEDDEKFVIRYKDHGNRMTVLLYHMNPQRQSELLQAGAADLVQIPVIAKQNIEPGDETKMRLSQALISNAAAASIAVNGVNPVLPFDFELSQNYPNPFNPTTTISFTIGSGVSGGVGPRKVSLEIFNVLGQRVTSLINDKMTPGTYNVVWDATTDSGQRVATGIYLYRLRVDEESQSKKMLFLK